MTITYHYIANMRDITEQYTNSSFFLECNNKARSKSWWLPAGCKHKINQLPLTRYWVTMIVMSAFLLVSPEWRSREALPPSPAWPGHPGPCLNFLKSLQTEITTTSSSPRLISWRLESQWTDWRRSGLLSQSSGKLNSHFFLFSVFLHCEIYNKLFYYTIHIALVLGSSIK